MDMQKLININKRKKIMIMTLVVFLCAVIIVGIQLKRNSSTNHSNPVNNKLQTTVDVLMVPRTGLMKRISLTGQTVPEAQVDIAAKYAGKIIAVNTKLGQWVSAGDVLIVQDTGDADISIMQNQAAYRQAAADAVTSDVSFHASYDKAKADYQKALTSYERYKILYEQAAISRESLDTSEQTMLGAKSVLDSLVNQMNANSVPSVIVSAQATASKAQYNVEAIQKQREDLVLRAPRSGMIGYRLAEVGAFATAGQKLLTIVDNSNVYVDCQVSEQDLVALIVGMDVNVQIESLGKTFPGKIVYMSPANDSSTQSFSLRIALTNIDPSVKTGMFTKTVINTIVRPNALVVPKNAVLDKNGQNYVFVVNSENVVEQRSVQVGARGDDDIEILGGLTDNEQIVISNLSRLKSGMTINPNFVTQANRGENQ